MKKQAQRSCRQTPPFVEFETVRQRFRISLPQQQVQNLIGIKDMQQINKHTKNIHLDHIITTAKSKRKQDNISKNQHIKNKVKGSDKNNQHNKSIQADQIFKHELLGQDRLTSQFTDKKSAKKSKIKNKSKEKQKDRIKKKKNSRQKDGFIQLKHSEDRSKGKYKNLHHFSECVYPTSQDLRQVYNIHANRQKNNRSYNAQQKTRVVNHRKLLSQCFPIIKKSKNMDKKSTEISKSINLSKNLAKLQNMQIIDEVLKSNSLDSLDYFRFQTNQESFSEEQSSSGGQEVKNLKITKNNKIIEELYSSGKLNEEECFDSEDQKLLTRISQDTQIMRRKSNSFSKPEKQIDFLPILLHKNKSNQIQQKSKQGQMNGQPHIEKDNRGKDQTYNHNRLLKTIDSILEEIGNFSLLKIDQNPQNKSKQQNGQNSNSNSMSSTLSAIQMSNFTYSKWNSLPSMLELEVILDNCLNQNVPLDKSRIIAKDSISESKDVGQNLLKCSDKERKIQFNFQQKWKQNKVKSIQKAKNFLKIGLYQATKLLGIKNPSENSNKQTNMNLEIGRNSNYGEKRIKIKCKSMLSLNYLQNYKNTEDRHKKHQKIQQKMQQKMEQKMEQKIERKELKKDYKQQNRKQQNSLGTEVFLYKKQGKIQLQMQIPKIYQKTANKESKRQRLSQLTTKQLQQIIQFICLDLYIGFIQQIEIQFQNPMNFFQSVYQALSKLRTSNKLGFSTAPKDVYIVLQKLSTYLEQTKQQNGQQKSLKMIIFERIKNSLGPKPYQLLKFMREVEYEPVEEAQQQKESFALNSAWFHQFSQKYVNQYNFGVYYFMDEDRQTKRQSFLKNAMHVHNKAIFDSINEIIDKHRPFGVIGEPFPWKKYMKPPQINFKNFNIILNKTFEQVVQNCKYLCGIFSEQHMNRSLTAQEYVQFSEDRLNRILCKDIQDNEIRWNFIDDEQTQILIQISNNLYKSLLLQTVNQIGKMKQKREKISLLT